MTVINASDVNDPKDLKKDCASCFLKMSTVSVEGLRQAFLDPQSRIRLHSDPQPESQVEFLAITWEGGFLRDTSVHFNSNLNAIIGGRGTGKSTMIESIRYVLGLDPLTDEARKAHEGILCCVLKSGTKISLLARSCRPTECYYLIERSVPNPPTVKDDTGKVLNISPRDVLPGVEVFGQHEISELTKSPEKLTSLLERFMDRDLSISDRKTQLQLELQRSRGRIMDIHCELNALDERLTILPNFEETEKRFQDAGLDKILEEKSLLIKEERLFSNLDEQLEPFRKLRTELIEELPVDAAFLSRKALKGLPNADVLTDMEDILRDLNTHLEGIGIQLAKALSVADTEIGNIRDRWDVHRKKINETYEKILRKLQKSNIDGAEFIQIRRQIENLRPLTVKVNTFKRELAALERRRHELLSEWEDLKASEYRQIENAAKKVTKKLQNRVRVKVTMAGNRGPFEQELRKVSGLRATTIDLLRKIDQLSLSEFAQCCREGKECLMEKYNLTASAAERIAHADPGLFMDIENLELPATTQIELNTAAERKQAMWQTFDNLSTGQKATAVLLLLLLESEAPLVVDQPEDDLDNRFITEAIVPIMRVEKQQRQFVLSTHNANIPVLGDAELILGLTASGDGSEGQAKIADEHMGSIDSRPVRELVEEILEGGEHAFEIRRSKYGF